MCRERLHILSFSGDNVCRVRQNVLLKVHILSPVTNCAGATKCAVTGSYYSIHSSCRVMIVCMQIFFKPRKETRKRGGELGVMGGWGILLRYS